MASSLTNLANNISEGNQKIKCNYGYDGKKVWRKIKETTF